MKRGETSFRVRYQETDQMGMVYYANYLVWMEVGRNEYLRQLGMPYTNLEKNKIYLPAVKVYCQYKLPAFYDDLIKVSTGVVDLQDVKISFKHDIFRENENSPEKPELELVALGETEYAFVGQDGKPLVLKKHNPFFWRRLQERVEGEEEK